jgi:hypothetical protein
VIVEEAHHMLPQDWDPGGAAVPADLEGFLFVTTHPDNVSRRVAGCVDRLLVVGAEPGKAVATFCAIRGLACPPVAAELAQDGVLLLDCDRGSARPLRIIPGTGDRRRHRRKYAEGRLGEDRSFYFRGPENKLNLRAHNLTMFVELADGVDLATWQWHRRHGDYSLWLRESVKDLELAAEVAAIERADTQPAEARRQLRAAVEQRYTAPG